MYLNNLQQDEVFVKTEMKPLQELTSMEPRRGLENVIISNGKIVNIVSKGYGHIPNELFFTKAEQMLIDAELNYHRQTINRSDRSFSMDFIIEDHSQFAVNHQEDQILPMLRFTNSYDGSERTLGHFGFFRKVCANGLHVAQSQIAFFVKHSTNSVQLIMPKLELLFQKFLDNEFYTISDQFSPMMTVPILDPEEFVREVLERTKLFRYECSDKNDDPSKKAREILEILDRESLLLHEAPNLWLGYNAFNAVLHRNLKKAFPGRKDWIHSCSRRSARWHDANKRLLRSLLKTGVFNAHNTSKFKEMAKVSQRKTVGRSGETSIKTVFNCIPYPHFSQL
ncbi:DUF932 domain-containing protein [Sinomicrobium weinanense]|uniref:DUF932 domain-containing protein n=1 Tax=Sinomicrobium weinanense TaxID=2842200 RepID=A0A926JVX3_9FLAO|nr:DUF932 domain-containing protein [Sinomicrobium weinanense]MBC9798455.1 DUF932 domain-containing protein [Sinomicrobium weinanense]MBU3125824.1 DUF945 domain-containing protein [Sinomicrobium weinanense]